MRIKGIDTQFIIRAVKYDTIPYYDYWDTKKEFPNYNIIDTLTASLKVEYF